VCADVRLWKSREEFGTDFHLLSGCVLAKGVHPMGDGKCAEVRDGIEVMADAA
jgi:hypothetical protein